MKQLIYGISMAAMMILLLIIIMTISGRNVRGSEIRQALPLSVKQSVDSLKGVPEGSYGTAGTDGIAGTIVEKIRTESRNTELLAEFAERVALKIKSNGKLLLYVGEADAGQGVLSVRAEEQFRHPNGQPGMVSAEQTVILEQYPLPQKKSCSISYRVGEELYKSYVLQEGSPHPVPQKPEGDFRFWADESGAPLPEGFLLVTGDKTYYAVFGG